MYWPEPSPSLLAEGVVTADELRRYTRHASVLLASAPDVAIGALLPERIRVLRRAVQWLEVTIVGVEQLLRETERTLAGSDTLDEPLTAPLPPDRMPTEP